MKKLERNNRILGRGLAKELCATELCNVTGGLEEAAGTLRILVHHTHSATTHDDCHIDDVSPDPTEEAAL